MAENAVGSIVMSVNGLDYDCTKFSSTKSTGNKRILTMNRRLKANYKSKGITVYDLTCTVVIPNSKDKVDWDSIEDARISIESPDGGFRKTFTDCNVVSSGDNYDVNGETLRDLSLFAMDCLTETF
ncbi:hypothetical protein F909_02879 [Acinetobacter sp. ANC 3929]|uniref:hypothetical protein n=1 Tax=Acinetobacter sp. ANC 3929 TaxID=1217707 RepID=UPI0002CFE151|nr:hypothetical protein [Acinetobacter sp. ANC 3929]ENW79776.1 hypothetical protein F909_02879 [Acinetobacter sp. ANC 3929]